MEAGLMTEERPHVVKATARVPKDVHLELKSYLDIDDISYQEWLAEQEWKFVETRRQQRQARYRQEQKE